MISNHGSFRRDGTTSTRDNDLPQSCMICNLYQPTIVEPLGTATVSRSTMMVQRMKIKHMLVVDGRFVACLIYHSIRSGAVFYAFQNY